MNAHQIRLYLKSHWFLSFFYMPLRNGVVAFLEWRRKCVLRRNFKHHGFGIVSKVNQIMDANGIRYFLDFGGLLGWIRENRFLPWDPDLDFGILVDGSDTIDISRAALQSAGFIWKKEYYDEMGRRAEDGYEINGIGVDFFFYYREGDAWRFSVFSITEKGIEDQERNVTKVVYQEPSTISKYHIGGVVVNMPTNYEAALIERYGKCWKVPDKKWRANSNDKQTRWDLGPVGKFFEH